MSRYIEHDARRRDQKHSKRGSKRPHPITIVGTGALAGLAALGAAKEVGVSPVGPAELGQTIKDAVNTVVEIERGPTQEQKKGAALWQIASPSSFVHDLVAHGELNSKGQLVKVNLRNRPSTKWGDEDTILGFSGGEVKGVLPIDFKVEKAVVVFGSNPSGTPEPRGAWYLFPDPKDPNIFYFAHTKGFLPKAELANITPFDLDQFVVQ